MKSLVDLKMELVDNKYGNVYIFTGGEHKVRSVYIERISSTCRVTKTYETVVDVYNELNKRQLIPVKTCYVVYDDMDYIKEKPEIHRRLEEIVGDNIVILVYNLISPEDEKHATFLSELDKHKTTFPTLTPDIAMKYIKKELKCNDNIADYLAYHCNYDYSTILMECNKIKMIMVDGKDVSEAMNWATRENVLLEKEEIPTPRDFSDALLTKNIGDLSYFINVMEKNDMDMLYFLNELMTSIMILITIKSSKNKYDGSSLAYEMGYYWGRVKELRSMNVPYNIVELKNMAYNVSQIDANMKVGRIPRELSVMWLLTKVF